MGDQPMPTSCLFVFLIIAAFAHANNEQQFTETTDILQTTAPEDIFLAAKSEVHSLKKKGVSHADCKELAKNTCKEVIHEQMSSQKVMNKVSSGKECDLVGHGNVMRAKFEEHKRRKEYLRWVKIVHARHNVKITISSQRFKSLRPGHCGFIFRSRAYLKAKLSYDRARKQLAYEKSRWEEARKMTVYWIKMSIYRQSQCRCKVVSARNRIWEVVINKKTLAMRNKAYAKCKMMQCVLDGTKLSSSKCQGKLPVPKKKILTKKAEKTNCKVKPVRPRLRTKPKLIKLKLRL